MSMTTTIALFSTFALLLFSRAAIVTQCCSRRWMIWCLISGLNYARIFQETFEGHDKLSKGFEVVQTNM